MTQSQKDELNRRGLWFLAGGIGLTLISVATLYRLGGLAAGFEYTVVSLVLGVCGIMVASRGTKILEAAKHIHKDDPVAESQGTVSVELEHSRWNNLGWGLVLLALAAVFFARFGSVGKASAALFGVFGTRNLYRFVMTLLRPPGRIRVDKDEVELPRGLCKDSPIICPRSSVRHAFMLRRSVPWGRTGPLLVVDLAEHSLVYPRDWFHSDADQERVAQALLEGQ